MKIALAIERLDVARGGRETSTAQIAAALAKAGHPVTILCQRASWQGAGVEVRPLGTRGLFRVQRLEGFVADVREAIGRGGFDIVHAMLPVPGANVYQPRGGTIPGQVAAGVRRLGWLGPARKALFDPLNLCRRRMGGFERQVADDSKVLCLAVSEMVGEEFARHYGRRENVRVIYNGVDVPEMAADDRAHWRQKLRYELGVSRDDTVFVVVAKNFALKGIAETVRFFARWYHRRTRRTDARLIVIGGHNYEGYHRLAALREVGAKVMFLPPTDDVFPWYCAADACVLLSWYDPCSRVVLEAARWGVPSVTTVYNGAAEVLADGAGIVVPSPAAADEVVRALDELADPAARAKRAAACESLHDRLSMDRHVKELIEAYGSLIR